MKPGIALALTLILTQIFSLSAQILQNPDLDGTVTGGSIIPAGWQAIPHSDPHCSAQLWTTATADLTSPTMPSPFNGVLGVPPSGNTFVSGEIAITPAGHFYHEGIMQPVTGLKPGQTYTLDFLQSVVKTRLSCDTSGSWAVLLNDSLVGITQPTVSQLPYQDIGLAWESRTLSFTAWQDSLMLKFLPWDDDTTYLTDSRLRNGGLRMGIDLINLTDATVTGRASSPPLDLRVFPNPSSEWMEIRGPAHWQGMIPIEIWDLNGRIVQREKINAGTQRRFKLDIPAGSYFLRVKEEIIAIRKI